jgi:hypothetical protein
MFLMRIKQSAPDWGRHPSFPFLIKTRAERLMTKLQAAICGGALKSSGFFR